MRSHFAMWQDSVATSKLNSIWYGKQILALFSLGPNPLESQLLFSRLKLFIGLNVSPAQYCGFYWSHVSERFMRLPSDRSTCSNILVDMLVPLKGFKKFWKALKPHASALFRIAKLFMFGLAFENGCFFEVLNLTEPHTRLFLPRCHLKIVLNIKQEKIRTTKMRLARTSPIIPYWLAALQSIVVTHDFRKRFAQFSFKLAKKFPLTV